jgi:hypothetical protein
MSSVPKHFSPTTCYSILARASQALLGFLGIVLLLTAGVASAKPSSTWTSNEILFIEDNLVDRQQVIDGVGPAVEVILLDAKADGLRQIAEALERRKNIAAVHLISHGAKAALRIGSLTLDREVLRQRGTDFARIRAALNKDADLLVYGCEVAQGSEGQRFIALLAAATGTRVAASTNLTCSAGLSCFSSGLAHGCRNGDDTLRSPRQRLSHPENARRPSKYRHERHPRHRL